MSQDLKVGDTCLVVKCVMFPEYVGRSVELIELLPPGAYRAIDEVGGVCFKNTVGSRNAWIIHSPHSYLLKTNDGGEVYSNFGAFAEYCLLKISGDPDKDKVLTRVLDLTT